MALRGLVSPQKFDLNPKGVAIGIDLGTTNSCVGYFTNGGVEIIITEGAGKRTVPSYVYFEKNECLVGDRAVNYLKSKPNHVVYDSKRMIGMNYEDSVIKRNETFWTFKVEKSGNRPVYAIDESHKVLPEAVSAEILKELIKMAQIRTGVEQITFAVITVPAQFTMGQKEATTHAAKLAGIDNVKLITEPTAAAFAYGFDHKRFDGLKLFVFDLGGGTLDVSIVDVIDGKFNVLRHDGDAQLGGRDYDNRLMHDLNEKYGLNVLGGNDEVTIKRKMRLREACENLKIRLSHPGKSHETIALDEIIPDLPDVTLSYKDFKELVKDLTRRCQKLCEVALEESATKIEDIDEVLLVGGSSKMRVIKDMLRDIFPNKTLSEAINPDEAVAYGATLRAAQLLDPEKSEGFGIMDKLSLGIGVALVENRYEILFKRNTRFPAKSEKKMYCTVFNNQEAMTFDIYEGERLLADQNYHIMSFELKGLPKKRAEEVRATLELELDENGILTAKATCEKKQEIHKVNHNEKKAKGQQIEDMLTNMEVHLDKDRQMDLESAARVGLRKNLEYIKGNAEEKKKNKFKPKEIDALLKECKEIDEWLINHNSKITPDIRDKFLKIEKNAQRLLAIN